MRWRQLWSGIYDFMATRGWPRLMLFATWLVLIVASYLSLRAFHPPDDRAPFHSTDGWMKTLVVSVWAALRDPTVPADLLLTLVIALPNLMLFVLARILLFRISRRRFNLVDVSDRGHEAEIPESAFERAHTLWAYERERTQTRYMANLLPQVAVFGVLSSMAVAGGILGLHGVFGASDGAGPQAAAALNTHAIVSVLAATVTSLLLAIGRLLMRIASNDATNRTFAYEARSFLFCVLSGVLFGCVLEGTDSAMAPGWAAAIGVSVGILGDRAYLAATQRAALLIGADAPAPTQALDLRLIEGLSPDDLSRLKEENVSTVHALAFVPAPRLFFNSSLNFQRICDWQDQALLIEYFGETKAKVLREQMQIRGVTDALALARRGEGVWKEMLSDLGFRGDGHTRFLLDKLKSDESVAVLRAYKRMTLAIEAVTSDAEDEPEAPLRLSALPAIGEAAGGPVTRRSGDRAR